ncbi:DUF29 family protein [Microseira sp. BLCC-F43]|jgi:prevent-host-death family protein|uniref:DUF29 family protein n=1 Tax=Microseira sp. BLCC-F43 TaxID=3153602 RepID=UPI0035B738E8
MYTVEFPALQADLTQLLSRVLSGEEVIISQAGTPIARIVPIADQSLPRIPGLDRGKVVISPDFNEPIPKSSGLYEIDFYAWTQEQVKFLQDRAWERLDISNLVEEIESLGKQQRQELRNRLGVLLGHLLQWEFQPENRSKSWVATIREQRCQVSDLLEENPSLKPYLPEALEKAYQYGLALAVRETSLSYKDFPQECLYEVEQVLNSSFFPGQSLESDPL